MGYHSSACVWRGAGYLFFIFCFLLQFYPGALSSVCAESDPQNGHPQWHERGLLVLTNACRMDPTGYRDTYVGSYNILLPSNYPATVPIYWNYKLNVCARNHSEDMANNCGMSHNSCSGTRWDTRVKTCYEFKSPKIGENVATGYEMPQTTMKQWITDGNPPPADKTKDGHRKNIMDKGFKEMGAGYAYGPKQYRHFWTQDLGGGAPDISNNIVSGSHFFFDDGKTSFMAVYYDVSGKAPAGARLILEGKAHALELHLGTKAKGAYRIDLAAAGSCRYYHFEFTDDAQKVWRYPETGSLATYGEGQCEKHYTTGTTNPIIVGNESYAPAMLNHLGNIVLASGNQRALELLIARLDGGIVQTIVVPNTVNAPEICLPIKNSISAGAYIALLKLSDGTHKKMRLLIAP